MDYLHKAKEILAHSLSVPIETIADDAKISDINQLDSLSFESIATGIENFLGHSVDPLDLLKLRSMQDMVAILKKK